MKKQDAKSQPEFSKVELLFNIGDGEKFQIKKNMKHLYSYDRANERIVDEKGEVIDPNTLLYILHHPDQIVSQEASEKNALTSTYSMVGKFMIYIMFFLMFALLMIKISSGYVTNFWSFGFLIPAIIAVICFVGMGVSAGFILGTLFERKEMLF